MKFRILSALLRSAWAIDERYAIAHGGIVAGLLNGMEPIASDEDVKEVKNSLPYAIDAKIPTATRYMTSYDEAPGGSMAIIPVRGPLMKEDQSDCGVFTAGMDTLSERVREADKHPNIDSIILYIDSPGGTVDGTQAFADVVKNASKPVVAFVDGLMASAAMWIGSSAQRIVAQNSTTEIGSIGVMLSFADVQPMWEKEGVVFHRIFADQSKDKNKEFIDALAGDYKSIKEQSLNPLADQFIKAMKVNRPKTSKDVFTGKVYFAEDALKNGLIDEIGGFDVALARAQELADEQNAKKTSEKEALATDSSKTTKKKPKMKALTLLTALLAVGAIEITDDGAFLNVEQLEAIEDKLAADAQALTDAKTAATEAGKQAERITELEGELADARKLPGAETAKVVVDGDKGEKGDENAKLEGMSIKERMEYLKKN